MIGQKRPILIFNGILKNFSDYKEAYYENYNGEIRFVLNGDKTDLIVGVNENGVQNYVMVYKSII